jgi:DNA-directed RNA polymerase specialized sigma24 family protein
MAVKKKGYIDNAKFYELLKEKRSLVVYLAEHTELENTSELRRLERVNNELGRKLIKIANGMAKRPNFTNYPHDQMTDMLSDAIFNMAKAVDGYDITRSNPFAYFSQITWNSFIAAIQGMKKRIKTTVNVEFLDNFDSLDNDMTGSEE